MEWIDRLATDLGVDALDEEQTAALLSAARDVAHRVERKTTPLAAYVLGTAAGKRIANGTPPAAALDEVLGVLLRTLPAPADEGHDG
ncbi:MAG TPA: DUF6457 domain-containing protein [Actinomycetota bacterium]|jgi:hypothetical protein|nr:DUF6457 domain-containing protein [Actinomycetota bacterium]